MSGYKEPAEKLPLAVRKNVRDAWESKREGYEAKLLELLGTAWSIDINPAAIYPYAEEGSYGQHSLGACINEYVSGFVRQLENHVKSHGSALKDELNSVAPAHKVTLVASKECRYCGVDIESGILRLKFQPDNLGTNVSDAADELPQAISAAPAPEGASVLSYTARHSIAKDFDTQKEEILEKARKLLQNPALSFEPGFDEVGKILKGNKNAGDSWERNLGGYVRGYYEAFVDRLRYEKFGDDDMLREGFAEGVEKGVIKFRIVEKFSKTASHSSYNGVVVEDGALILETTPEYFGTNVSDVADGMVNLL